jgi:F-type H+-transporting ATPase subunit epsilon
LEAKRNAEEALQNKSSDVDYARASAELASALAQLTAIQRLHKDRH